MKVQFAAYVLDVERRQLVRGGEPVHLSPKAFELLRCLVEKRPNAVAKQQLYERIWPGTFVVDANLTVLVAELRRALGDDPQAAQFIRTVPKFGYAFTAEAAAVATPAVTPEVRMGLTLEDRVLFLGDGEHVVGRDPACDIWIDRSGVSRRHARLRVHGGEVTIDDLGSKNGTFVGDVALAGTRRLADGDVIQLGSAELRFRVWRGGGAETERIQRKKR